MAPTPSPRWISWWFRIAALYGIVVLAPQYLRAAPVGGEVNFYGFIGTALAFQLAFWVIATDPARYRALMPVCVVEKLVFGLPVLWLYAAGRIGAPILAAGVIDLVLCAGFVAAWRATRAI